MRKQLFFLYLLGDYFTWSKKKRENIFKLTSTTSEKKKKFVIPFVAFYNGREYDWDGIKEEKN